jgi:hypothetical protein
VNRFEPGVGEEAAEMHLSHERRAKNGELFREVNERIASYVSLGDRFEIVCECSNLTCYKQLQIDRAVYTRARSEPTLFLIAVGHADAAIEDIIETTDEYQLVRKKRTASAAE